MKARIAVGAVALGLALMSHPAQAQVVQAGVVIRSGPVYGHVVVGDPVVYPEPPRRVYVERPYPPRVIVVEAVRRPRGHAYGWWQTHYRPIVVYYDGARYYDRWFGGRPGLRRIDGYQRGGRYYRWGD
jgi:hypothetical protein